ncbi:hypothetical protein [Pseudofrankia sp. BMG5.37]|uniref:putative acetyltransferase n=1 Tax=Pseudofrankia sp. BMG5.37 TaxID=3050035 RepID=UPI0008DADA46|nr:hypothetical protein [Pseudofrankia sp. BMG5.37]OHV48233.1 hypothetical protein BCD48_16050 [Pseudofrankia sp. BMG5.36]
MYVVRITRADIGARVVIRRRIAGPVPLTDVIGTLQAWTAGVLTIAHANGEIISIPEDDLIAAKVIPPPPIRGAQRGRRQDPDAQDVEARP